ncbi:MAG: hypothetical protein Q6366_006175 [Candidatus Freyarchaeota archaeon]
MRLKSRGVVQELGRGRLVQIISFRLEPGMLGYGSSLVIEGSSTRFALGAFEPLPAVSMPLFQPFLNRIWAVYAGFPPDLL